MTNCPHTLRHGPLCALCGQTIHDDEQLFCLLHTVDSLQTTPSEAKRIAKQRKKGLDKENKLILIIDLDHTILHASINKRIEMYKGNIINIDTKPAVKELKEEIEAEKYFEKNKYTVKGSTNEESYILKQNHVKTFNNEESLINRNSCLLKQVTIDNDEITCEKPSILNKDQSQNPKNVYYTDECKDMHSLVGNQRREFTMEDLSAKRRKVDMKLNLSDGSYERNIEHPNIYTFNIMNQSYYVKIRPYLNNLLDFCLDKFEMHVYTMGNRAYALNIVKIIDPDGVYFGDRIITRDENLDKLEKSLNRLSSEHRNIVVLDDRADVWSYCMNVLLVHPFIYFTNGDINSPDGKSHINTEGTSDEAVIIDRDDKILLFIKNILDICHFKYFDEERDIKKVLKSMRCDILKGLRFTIADCTRIESKYLKCIIKSCAGKVRNKKVDYIITSKLDDKVLKLHDKTRADVVNENWLVECYMLFKRVSIGRYILKEFVDDKILKEFEDFLN